MTVSAKEQLVEIKHCNHVFVTSKCSNPTEGTEECRNHALLLFYLCTPLKINILYWILILFGGLRVLLFSALTVSSTALRQAFRHAHQCPVHFVLHLLCLCSMSSRRVVLRYHKCSRAERIQDWGCASIAFK